MIALSHISVYKLLFLVVLLLSERVDRELREKEKIRSDLEKAEKLKSQLAAEVDEHHSAIERANNLNLR